MDNEWNYFQPSEKIYTITTFDDGNHKYQHYANKWFMYGSWRGKCALVNQINPAIKIESISCWKINAEPVSMPA